MSGGCPGEGGAGGVPGDPRGGPPERGRGPRSGAAGSGEGSGLFGGAAVAPGGDEYLRNILLLRPARVLLESC